MSQPLIDEKSRQMLQDKFQAELQDEVSLSIFVGEENQEFGDFTVQLCEELHELDGRIKPTVYRNGNGAATAMGVTSTPTVLIGWDQGYRIKYRGAPVGHEAGGFIETIALVSRGESGLQDDSLARLAEIDQDTTIQVFVTPTCTYCPRSVLLANQIAIAAKGRVTAECVEASQNMELARQFNVSSVPQQVINEDPESISIGAQPEPHFVNQVLSYGSSRYEEIMAEEQARRALAEKLVDNPTGPVTLTDNNFENAVAQYPALVVDCWAEWCAPCRMVAPIVDSLSFLHRGQVVFGKLDVDHNQAIASSYGIMSIPTLLFFKDGKLVGTRVGTLPQATLEIALKEYGLVQSH
jgi:thioredoxin